MGGSMTAASRARVGAAFVACLVGPLAASAATLRVPAEAATIQAAVDLAAPGDTVLVAPGTYFENVALRGRDVVLESESGPAVTIIDGQRRGTVLTIPQGSTRATVIRGFTLRNGEDPHVGGGIRIQFSSPTIVDSRIVDNFGCSGVGINSYFGSPLLEGNVISRNVSYGRTGCRGGGVYVGGSGTAEILDNEVSDNRVDAGGGGIELNSAGRPVVSGNRVLRNQVTYGSGGGLEIVNDSDVELIQNLIAGNRATHGGGGIEYLVPSGSRGPRLVSNTIAANESPNGSALLAMGFDAAVEIVNNILVSATGPAVVCEEYYDNAPPSFRQNVVWAATAPAGGGLCGSFPDASNLSADPLLVNPTGGDFRLRAGSPAIDAGDGAAIGIPPTDISGGPRVVDGIGSGARIDIGAYEFLPPVSPLSLDFGAVQLSRTSAPLRLLVRNDGDAPLAVSWVAAGGEFGATHACTQPIPPGATCPVDVTFSPRARGERTGSVAIGTDRFVWRVSARGWGIAPTAVLTPAALEFGPVPVWGTSAAQTVTLTNTGDAPLTVSGVSAWGYFQATSGCVAPLQPSESCAISVVFHPTTGGAVQGNLFVSSDSLEYAGPVALSGTGTTQLASLNASGTIDIGVARPGETGHARFVLTNAGGDLLTVHEVRVSGGAFAQTNDCSMPLGPGGTCIIWVTFRPTERVEYTGELVVLNDGLVQPKVTMTARGGVPIISVTPTSLTFEKTGVGRTSAPQPVTITNTGEVQALSLTLQVQGDFYWGGQCGSLLGAGESCTAWVYFAPTTRGDLVGAFVVGGDSAQPVPVVSLAGRAVGPR